MKPQNLPETLIWYYIIYSYGIYLLGAQYVLSPLLATFLTCYLIKKWWDQTEETPSEERVNISPAIWIWIAGMLVIEVALIVGHVNFNESLSKIIISSLGWYRKWALLAMFPLVGHLNIRPKIIYRAVCIFCLQSLILIPFLYLAMILHLPNELYTSPLKIFKGPSSGYRINLYHVDTAGQTRLTLIAPWAPALGLLANIYLCIVLKETNKKWRHLGIAGAVAMSFVTVSRLSILALGFVPVVGWFLSNLARPGIQLFAGVGSFMTGILSTTLLSWLKSFKEAFHKMRPNSSNVRDTLEHIAVYRWKTEFPIWGRGTVGHLGPKLVEYMQIGSHHTWFGVLFHHGLVGFVGLLIPVLWSFIELLVKAQRSKNAQVALNILIVMLLFTFAENIETVAYLYWPGLVILGIAFKEPLT